MLALDLQPRCWSCNKLLAEKVTRPWTIRCGRCKNTNEDSHQGIPRRTILVDELTQEQAVNVRTVFIGPEGK